MLYVGAKTDRFRHCGEGDGEVSLTRAAATDSHEETTSSGEAVDCHAHAGVE